MTRRRLVMLASVAVVPWLGYALRHPPFAIHYGPRYVFDGYVLLTLFVGIAFGFLRKYSKVASVGAVCIVCAVQARVARAHVGELALVLFQASQLDQATAALREAVREPSTIAVLGPSGSIPPSDLPRNDVDFDDRVLLFQPPPDASFGARTAPRLGRSPYAWDGMGSVPVLWTADSTLPTQQIVVTAHGGVALPRDPRNGWLVTWAGNACAQTPYLLPGLRDSPRDMGPCGDDGAFRVEAPDATIRVGRRGGVAVTLRAFVRVPDGGRVLRFRGTSGIRCRAAVDGSLRYSQGASACPAPISVRAGLHFLAFETSTFEDEAELRAILPDGVSVFVQTPDAEQP